MTLSLRLTLAPPRSRRAPAPSPPPPAPAPVCATAGYVPDGRWSFAAPCEARRQSGGVCRAKRAPRVAGRRNIHWCA